VKGDEDHVSWRDGQVEHTTSMEELKKIEEIRTRFLYDFEGNTRCILCDVGDIIT